MDPFIEPDVAFLTFTFMAGEEIEVCAGGGGGAGEMCEDIICRGAKKIARTGI